MPKKLTTEKFIYEAKLKHGNKYDYSLVNYINSTTKVAIICPTHGVFKQLPARHLYNDNCPKCGNIKTGESLKLSPNAFIEQMKIIHPDIVIMEDYKLSSLEILIKDKYGIEYLAKPYSLLSGRAPTIQIAVNKNLAFKIKSNAIHKNKYNYDKVNYLLSRSPVTITCLIHGDFNQTPSSHISGYGCPLCSKLDYARSSWINFCNNKDVNPKVYIIHCFNKIEKFVKIGITSKQIKHRFSGKKMPYSYKIIKEIKGSPDFIFDKEIELHKLYKEYRYYPLIKFDGFSECFNISILNMIT